MTEYLPLPNATLRQGDVVLAPSVVLLAAHEVDITGFLADPPDQLGDPVYSLPWRPGESSLAPDVVAETVLSPVLVLSHDCQLEKDFNEAFSLLVSHGLSREEARSAAASVPGLDPWAVVAPLQPYNEVPEHRHEGIRAGTRIGYLALDTLSHDGGDYLVDLGRACTVSVRLLPREFKLASLAPASVAELQYKLAEIYAIRDLAVVSELQAMIGQRIVDVEVLPKSRKKTALVLRLEDGDLVHLEIRRPRDEVSEEVTRVPADPS